MHMMIDIETLSTDARALVFQIGVVIFELGNDEIRYSAKFHLDILPQIMLGRVFDHATQKFWMEQDYKSWMRSPSEVVPVPLALGEINALLGDHKVTHVWANSPSFDGVILRSLAKDFSMELKWDFRSEMDVRTIKSMNSIARLNPADPMETTHDSVQDCIDQVRKVNFYWRNFTVVSVVL